MAHHSIADTSSAARLRWLLPLAGATAASQATDTHTMRFVVSNNPSFNASNDTTSTLLRDILIGAPIALFGTGELRSDQHARDAGLLAGEAMINAYATGEATPERSGEMSISQRQACREWRYPSSR